MCGLAGLLHRDGGSVDREALRRMTRALTHRGPDDEGYFDGPGIGLGHRRLSIIDLASGRQPIANEDGTVWVAFNGEIFNYVELRADLIKRGHQFRTQSDTETLVHLYEESGVDFVDQLNGQFAIALWDSVRRRLVLVRDRVGIRPLFHSVFPDGTVAFASEMKAILAHGAIKAEIDPIAVGQIATLWVSVPPRTPFKQIEELGPGRMLVFEDGRRTERRYWRHEFPAEHEYEDRSLDYWQAQVRGLLDDAVRLQLRADVPVASYLSGGLDSAILTTLAKRRMPAGLTTFSLGFTDARFDERQFQRQMVEFLQTDHREIELSQAEIGQAFSDTVWFAERPLMRTAPAPLLALSGLVHRTGIKVVVTGEGADEVFGGYNLFREDKIRRFCAGNPTSSWRPSLFSRLYGYVKRDARSEAFWQRFFMKDVGNTNDPYYSHRIRWDNTSHLKRLFTADFRAQMQSEDALFGELDNYLEPDRAAWHPLCRAQYLEMALFMSCYLLNSQGDRMLMANSVEGRVPFLDHRLVELGARIPPKYKIRALNEKYILKQTFADILPPEIARRPKTPYRAPISPCFGPGSANLAVELLTDDALKRSGFVEPSSVARLRAKTAEGAVGASERDEMALATVTSLQLLNHHFVTDFQPDGRRSAAS